MYTPLKTWGARNGGKKVGFVGLGGLGQMGLKLAKAMGNEVTIISRSTGKESIVVLMSRHIFFIKYLFLSQERPSLEDGS